MVRVILLEPGEGGWTVGLLYHAPEAAADSSEASDGMRFAAAEGGSLDKALAAAEAALPKTPSFRLCDYLLLMPGGGWQALGEYEDLVLERGCGRTGARLAACEFTCAELSQATEEADQLLTGLLQALKQMKKQAPRLYESRACSGLLLPLLALGEEGPRAREEGLFLSAGSREEWDAEKAAAYRLLTGRGEEFSFWLGGRRIALRRPLHTVTLDAAGSYTVRVDCQPAPGSPRPTDAERARLASLCGELVRSCWDAGHDILSLGSYAALRDGEGAAPTPAKNACPQLRAGVEVY